MVNEEAPTKPIEDMSLDELEELEDDVDERILLEYRSVSLSYLLRPH